MKKLIFGPVGGEWEGCAIAEADYEESDAQGLEFESLPRRASGDGEIRQLPWLPGKSRYSTPPEPLESSA